MVFSSGRTLLSRDARRGQICDRASILTWQEAKAFLQRTQVVVGANMAGAGLACILLLSTLFGLAASVPLAQRSLSR